MKKAFYFDVETTGLDERRNGLTQIACIIEYGTTKDSLVLDLNPLSYTREVLVTQEALQITGKTVEILQSYPSSKEQFSKFIEFLDKHINKFDSSDKLYPIGFNSTFDMRFLIEWFVDNENPYFGSYFYYKDVDVYKLYSFLLYELEMPYTQNHKLGTLCEAYGIKLENAHDALADIEATKELYKIIKDGIKLDKKLDYFMKLNGEIENARN